MIGFLSEVDFLIWCEDSVSIYGAQFEWGFSGSGFIDLMIAPSLL